MKSINIIKGEFEHTKWMLEEDKLTLGTYNVQDIPIREIIAVEKKEIIKKDYYIVFKLGSGQTFTATMKEKTYNHVYKAFISKGNHPTNIHLPIKSKSNVNVIWACVGLAVLFLFMSGEYEPNATQNTAAAKTMSSNESYAEKQRDKREAQGIIRRAGYQCDDVISVNVMFSIHVTCDNYINRYEIEKKGGHWVVHVK